MRRRLSSAAAAAAAGMVLALLPVMAPVAQARPEEGGAQQPRSTPVKPARATIPDGYAKDRLHLKFQEGTAVRLRSGRFASDRDDLSGVEDVLRRYPGTRIQRLFDRPEATLDREKKSTEASSRRQQADFNLYYRLLVAPRQDGRALIDELNALSLVEIAYAEPLPVAPPVTPSFVSEQNYREAAADGVDADAFSASTIVGGRGENVRIIDIEYSWNTAHEDLAKARAPGALVSNGTPTDPFNSTDHGTAVIGEMVADANDFGVTGLASGAGLGLTNASNTEDGYDLADSINTASAALAPGDLILIEQQTAGLTACVNSTSGCVAVEWVQAFYDAIVGATSSGRIVIEAAGNGNENLDAAGYGAPFPAGRADSGAIIVGAGNMDGCTAPAHGRRGFSTFGARVNFHAYGECVVTTGYGTRQAGPMNEWYSNSFSGTSSASPIVTGAAAIASSIAQAQGDADGLTSTEVRTLLATGATPQDTTTAGALTGNIGPMPNLLSALAAYRPSVEAGGPYSTVEGTDVTVTATGSDPQGGALTYAWDLDNDGTYGDATGASVTFDRVGQDGALPIGVQITDAGGLTSTDTAVVNVANVAPAVAFSTDTPRLEGGVLTLSSGSTSDAGWLDDLAITVDWGDGAGASSLTASSSENQRPNATKAFSTTHVYGDNGVFTVQVCASDDDTPTCAQRSVTIGNVVPSATIDESATTSINGVPTLIAHAGQPVAVPARSTDPGSDDLTLSWAWGDGTTTSHLSLSGALADPPSSPELNPRDVARSESHAFGAACAYTVGFSSKDDDGGTSALDTLAVLIAGNADRLRGAGYWQSQFKGTGTREFGNDRLLCYLAITGSMSRVFHEVRNVSTIAAARALLDADKPTATPKDQLDRQLLATWLNFANGSADLSELVDTNGDGVADTAFSSVMATAETVRLSASATRNQLIEQKSRLERVNTSHGG